MDVNMHAHNVFFTLKDKSSSAVDRFIADSQTYLAVLPGIISFQCGIRERKLNREVNDLDFDVSLHVLFENKEMHDSYQKASSHDDFVSRNSDNWAKVRVFDTETK